MSDPRYVFCLYADDFRQEVNGKTSLIGIYQGGMNVQGQAPVQLARLVVCAHISTPKERPFRELEVQLLWNDKVLQSHAPPSDVLAEMQVAAGKDEAARLFCIQLAMVIQPFEVPGDGTLKVAVLADDERLDSNALRVTIVKNPTDPGAQVS